MYRALIEGIAFGTAHAVEAITEAGRRPLRVFAVGGGTRNELWLQSTSDASGLDQIVREKTVGASYGNAFLAAQAVGLVGPDDIRRWNPVARDTRASPSPALERNYDLFRELYESTKDTARKLGDPI